MAGLARRVHDSGTLQAKFDKYVAAADMHGQKTRLDRRVPTRWNSDFACLAAHVHFEQPVKMLTSDERLGLQDYALTLDQWALGHELVEALDVCTYCLDQDITLILT